MSKNIRGLASWGVIHFSLPSNARICFPCSFTNMNNHTDFFPSFSASQVFPDFFRGLLPSRYENLHTTFYSKLCENSAITAFSQNVLRYKGKQYFSIFQIISQKIRHFSFRRNFKSAAFYEISRSTLFRCKFHRRFRDALSRGTALSTTLSLACG